jgi:hypothetical protein
MEIRAVPCPNNCTQKYSTNVLTRKINLISLLILYSER